MRVFIAVLVLIFSLQSLSKAEDISEFEIEGMSIEDSLLEFMTKNKIDQYEKTYHYATKDYYQIDIAGKSELYERIAIDLKNNDDKFLIKNIEGAIEFKDKNKKRCQNLMEEIANSLSQNFNLKRVDDKGKLDWDKSGKSTYDRINFILPNAKYHQITIICQYWDESTPFGYWLKTGIHSNEFLDYLEYKAYN